MADVSIQFPERDVDNLMRAMERQSRSLGIPMREATQNAAKLVAYSAAAATTESKKYRKYQNIRKPSKSRAGLWRVQNDRPNKRNFNVSARSVKELKEKPGVRIVRRGLAKSVWRIIGAQIGGSTNVSAGKSNASGKTESQSRKFGAVKIDQNIFSPSVTLTNSLGYAMSAVNGGQSALNNIVGKAARRMHKLVNNAVKQKMKAA